MKQNLCKINFRALKLFKLSGVFHSLMRGEERFLNTQLFSRMSVRSQCDYQEEESNMFYNTYSDFPVL